MEHCVVCLCQKDKEGLCLYNFIRKNFPYIQVFCIFYGHGKPESISSIESTKRFILPENTSIESAIRASMIWVPRINLEVENIIFCNDSNFPSLNEIFEAWEYSEDEKNYRGKNVWSISLISAILSGWDSEQRSFIAPLTPDERLVAMGKAMRGEIVSDDLLLDAMIEMLPANLIVKMTSKSTATSLFLQRLMCRASYNADKTNGIVFPCDLVPNFPSLQQMLPGLQNGNVLALVGEEGAMKIDNYLPARPYKVLKSAEGTVVAFFSNQAVQESR